MSIEKELWLEQQIACMLSEDEVLKNATDSEHVSTYE